MRLLLLDEKQNIFSSIVNPISAIETQEINVASQLNMSVLITKGNLESLSKAKYIAVPVNTDSNNKYHLFNIQSLKTADDTIEIVGIEDAFDELSGYGYLQEYRQIDKSLKDVSAVVFNGTRWQVGTCPTITSTVYIYYISRLEALKKIVVAYGVEVQFIYTIVDNRIVKRKINFFEQIGTETNRRFVYGQGALSVSKEENRVSVFTAAVGRGKGLAITDDNGVETGGFERKLKFDDIAWSKGNGDPEDKPLGQEWIELPDATQLWGYSDGTPRTTIYDFPDIEDKQELLQQTYEKLVEDSRPKVQFKSTLFKAGFLNLGDSVIIVRHDLNIVYKARVFKIERNLLNDNLTTVDIGDYLLKTQPEREQDLLNSINQVEDNINNTVTNVVSDLNNQMSDQKTEIGEKIVDINQQLVEQHTQSEEAISQAVEDVQSLIKEKTEAIKTEVSNFVSQNSNGPITVYGEDGQVAKGMPKISALKGDGFELNSSGFNFGGRLIGGDGKLVADEVAAMSTITSPIIEGGEVHYGKMVGVSVESATMTGLIYIRSTGSGGVAVMSGDYGFSFGNSAIGADSARLPNTVIQGNLTVHGAIWADETIKSGKAS